MKSYSIGTAMQYDSLPLLPAIDTTNGGIRLNNNISMTVGAKVEFDGLRFFEITSSYTRILTSSTNPYTGSRVSAYVVSGESVFSGLNCTISNNYPSTTFSPNIITSKVPNGQTGSFFVEWNADTNYARCISKSFRVKNSSGIVMYRWLDQVSDYKSTPINASIVGAVEWLKIDPSGVEISNYLTGTLLHNALLTTPPTEPVTIYVLSRSTDVSMIQSSYNGQPVTISYDYAPNTNAKYGLCLGYGYGL